MMTPVGPEGSAAHPYRENPPEHLKEVHWISGEVPPGVNIAFQAIPDVPEGESPPFYGADDSASMTVGTADLPLASPATLVVPIPGEIFPANAHQQVFGEFPDGSGRVQAQYFLSQAGAGPGQRILRGSVFYVTNNSSKPYGGAHAVSISVHVVLRLLLFGVGWRWTAAAFCGAASAVTSGSAPGGGAFNLTATMIIKPASVSFG